MKKRMMVWLLVVAMVVSQIPATVFAAETKTSTQATVDEAVAAVEAQIDDLPMVSMLETMDDDALTELYATAQAIADAYDALTEDRQGQVTNIETLKAFLEWFAVPETMAVVRFANAGEYDSFDEAFGKANNGYTLILLQDADFNGNSAFQSPNINLNITLQLAGHTLYAKAPSVLDPSNIGYSYVYVASDNQVTIQGPGTLGGTYGLMVTGWDWSADQLDAGTVTLTDNVSAQYVSVSSGGTLNVHNATIPMLSINGSAYHKTTLNMSGGSVTKLIVGTETDKTQIAINLTGGSFGEIKREGSAPTFSEMLADGYEFQYTSTSTRVPDSDMKGTTLSGVKVVAHTHTFDDNGECPCGSVCNHTNSFDSSTGKCKTCQKDIAVAKVTSGSPSVTTYYQTFQDAFNAAANGGIITLTKDAQYQQLVSIMKRTIQIQLDGHTLQLNSNVNIYTSNMTFTGPGSIPGSTFNVCSDGTMTLNGNVTVEGVKVVGSGQLTVENATVKNLSLSDQGQVTVTGGEITEWTVESSNAKATLSGGKFGSIQRDSNAPAFSAMLKEGYAFQDSSKAFIKLSELTGKTELKNVTVAQCTHGEWTEDYACGYCGYTCDHGGFNSNTGKCDTCQKELGVAKVTSGSGESADTKYYQTFKEAYDAMANSGDTLTLVKNVLLTETEWKNDFGSKLTKAFTFDLNGHSFGIDSTTTNIVFDPISYACTVKNGILGKSEFFYIVILDGVASECVVCKATSVVQLKGTCKITNLTCEQYGSLDISGGSYTSITVSGGKSVGDLLEAGYVYQHNTETDKTYIKRSELAGKTTLENVTVTTCPHDSFEAEAPKCDYCGKDCNHANVDTNDKCTACKIPMEAAVISGTGENQKTSYYAKFTDALAKATDGDTVKLLTNVTHTNAGEDIIIDKSMTLDLNGKTLDVGTAALFFRTTATLKNGTVKGNVTAKASADVEDMKLTVETVTVENGKLWVEGIDNPVSVTVKEGSLNELYVESMDQKAQVQLYGGSYGKITTSLITVKSFLPAGYAYQKNGTILALSELGNSLENVTVTKCTAHGAPTDSDLCGYCNTALVASVTAGENTTYYTAFTDAVDYVNSTSGGATVKLLKDVNVSNKYTLRKSMTLDLNGKTLNAPIIAVNGCTLTVKSSKSGGCVAGVIDTRTVTSEIRVESGNIINLYVSYGKATITGGLVVGLYVLNDACVERCLC